MRAKCPACEAKIEDVNERERVKCPDCAEEFTIPEQFYGDTFSNSEAYEQWYEALERASRTGKVSENMRSNYDSMLKHLVNFFRSEIGGDREATPDSILKWAKASGPDDVVDVLNNFEDWLQGIEVEGYEKRVLVRNERYLKPDSASQRAHGSGRGFFTHNKLWLPKSPRKRGGRSATKKNDANYAVFVVDEDTNRVVQDYSLFRLFLSNLSFRDKTVALCVLSTSQDTGDLLELKMKFVKRQEGKERLYWAGTRNKTGEEFRTFFSRETTRYLKQYIEQERKGAKEDEPIFLRTNDEPLVQRNVSENFNHASHKMGLINDGVQNPFRPKRLRSIFSSACYQAKIDDGARHIFMGHAGSTSEKYREMPVANLELIYTQVEPFITVYAEDRSQELAETRAKSEKALDLALDIRAENKMLKERLQRVEQYMTNLQNMYKERLSPEQEAMIEELAEGLELLPKEERIQQLKALLFAWVKAFMA